MIRTKYIPTDRIRAMEIYINRDRLSLSAIVEREGPDLSITGNFYGPDWKPVCPLKADGQVAEPTSYYTSKYTGEEMDALLDKVAAQSQS